MDNQPTAGSQTPAGEGLRADNLSEWPGAFGIYKYSQAVVKRNWQAALGLVGLTIAISILQSILENNLHVPASLGNLVANILSIFISVALTLVLLAGVRGKSISLGDALKQSGSFFWNYLLVTILSGILVFVSLLLFIIPFFFVMPRLILAPYYVIDRKLGAIDALKASWNDSKPHVGKVWGIIGVTLLFALAIFVVVGLYFTFMYLAATAILYVFITGHQATDKPVASTTEVQ